MKRASRDQVTRDLAKECERRVSRIVSDFEDLTIGDEDAAFQLRIFIATSVFAGLCGMTVARSNQSITEDNVEAAARQLLEAMLPTLRKAAKP